MTTVAEKLTYLANAEESITRAIGFIKRAYPTRGDLDGLEQLYFCQKELRDQLAYLRLHVGASMIEKTVTGLDRQWPAFDEPNL